MMTSDMRASFTMEHSRRLLVSCVVLLSAPHLLCLPGGGEKLRINPDDFERVVQISNLTKRDPTAKNVNFAWKMTVRPTIATTQDPARTSTLNAEQSKKNNEIYDKLFAQLAYTLRDKVYLNRWLTEMDKGYHIFLYEIQKQDKYHFLKRHDKDPDAFEGDKGYFLFDCMLDFLRGLGSKNEFEIFRESLQQRIDQFEVKTTLSWAQRNVSLTQAYNMMFVQLAYTLKDAEYRHRWLSANMKGFDMFLRDLDEFGVKWFIRPMPEDETFVGEKGKHFWDNIVSFFRYSRQAGFDALLKKIDSLPDKWEAKDIIQLNLPDVGEIMRYADKTGTLTPINFDLYTITTKPMEETSTPV